MTKRSCVNIVRKTIFRTVRVIVEFSHLKTKFHGRSMMGTVCAVMLIGSIVSLSKRGQE